MLINFPNERKTKLGVKEIESMIELLENNDITKNENRGKGSVKIESIIEIKGKKIVFIFSRNNSFEK